LVAAREWEAVSFFGIMKKANQETWKLRKAGTAMRSLEPGWGMEYWSPGVPGKNESENVDAAICGTEAGDFTA